MESLQPLQERGGCYRSAHCVRRVKSKGAVLILLWNVAVWYVFYVGINVIGPNTLPSYLYVSSFIDILASAIYLFYCPLAGWLADVYFGRYKLMHSNLLLMWFGSIIAVLGLIVDYQFTSTPKHLTLCVLFLAYILIVVGSGGIVTNTLPFGTDQLLDAPSEEISCFVHWFLWTWFAGSFIQQLGSGILDCTLNTDVSSLIQLLIAVAAMSVALCSDYLYRKQLIMEPESQNPLKMVVDALKYAATHKYPTRRSAFTYWEEEIPSRVDLGKSKYGGPFTTEQVEDVKTFLRILVVILAIHIYVVSAAATINPVNHYKQTTDPTCFAVSYVEILIVLGVPFYELMLHPLIGKWVLSSLKRVGAGALLIIVFNLMLMVVDVIGHAKTDTEVPCMFAAANDSSPRLDISDLWVDIPYNVVHAVLLMIFYITTFEFICAQSPYSMKGLLTGFTWAMSALAVVTGSVFYYLVSSLPWPSYTTPSCGFWYYLFTALIGIIGLVVLVIVARWYRRRERNEVVNERIFAENYYSYVTPV